MLENKEQEKIAGIISDFFDGAVNEADIDILAMKIYEKYVAKLEQDLEFTTKTANELIEIKHKLEKELAELKEKAIVPKFKVGQEIWCIQYMAIFKFKINKVEIHRGEEETENRIIYGNWEDMIYQIEENCFTTEQEAQEKLKEIQGNE